VPVFFKHSVYTPTRTSHVKVYIVACCIAPVTDDDILRLLRNGCRKFSNRERGSDVEWIEWEGIFFPQHIIWSAWGLS